MAIEEETLSAEAREEALAGLHDWRFDAERQALAKAFRFRDFADAFAFMTRVAFAAERADHHPDWSNSWNRVDVLLTTHAAGGVTMRDIDLAREIDAAEAQLASAPSGH